MERQTLTTDVCVVGGGPAGASLAARLAALKFRVTIVESQQAAGRQVAATLPPGVLPLLDVLGVRARVESAGFLRSAEIGVLWANERPELRMRPDSEPGLHVLRESFDRLLLEAAAEAGARVVSPARAMRMVRESSGGWRLTLEGAEGIDEILCRFVVDASGGRWRAGAHRERLSPPLVALTAIWRGAQGTPAYGCLEAGAREWMWSAPLSVDSVAVAVVLSPERARGRETREALYRQVIDGSRLICRSLRGGQQSGPLSVCDASMWISTPLATTETLCVGDAAVQLDPLSSQGVVTGIAGALQAGAVINTILRRPENAALAIELYTTRQTEKAIRHRAVSAAFYREMLARSEDAFWVERSLAAGPGNEKPLRTGELDLNGPLVLSGCSVRERVPVIAGDFVEAQPALQHESLEQPVAFLGDVPLLPLLTRINGVRTAGEVVREWRHSLSAERGFEILTWLWQRRMIVTANNAPN